MGDHALRLGFAGQPIAAARTDLGKYPWEFLAWEKSLGKVPNSSTGIILFMKRNIL